MSKVTKSFSLDPDIAEFASELDNASKVVGDLLKQYQKGGMDRDLAALELRMQQKRSEWEKAQEMAEMKQQQFEELQELHSHFTQEENSKLEEARKELDGVARNPDNPGIRNWAQKLGMTPDQLIEKL